MSRSTAMRIIASVLIATGVAFSAFTIIFWIVTPGQAIHAVHNVVVSSLILVLTVPPLVGVARAPERSKRELLILAVVTAAGLVAMALSLTPDPFILPVLVLIVVLWALAPDRKGVWPPGSLSPVMLVAVLAAAVLLIPYGAEHAALQRSDHASEHAAFFHWVETAFYAGGILGLGLLGALRPAGFRMATLCAGAALALLGAASVAFAQQSSLPASWSWVALIGGLAFVAVGEWESRRQRA